MASVTPQLPGLELLEEVGRGARNLVYRARLRGRLVAIKIPRQRDDLETIYRDYRCEASLQARVSGGGLLEVYEVGRHQDLPFIVQELVESAPLSEALKRGPYPAESIVRLGQQLAATLAAVHERGLVHRDVKPANILVSPGGPARLIDFGLATRSHLSKTNVLTGTFRYSAPEQTGMLDRPLDGRADLYALGAVLYECVCGRPPFQAEDPGELIRLHALAVPPPLPDSTPPQLAQAIVRLLAKDPDDRFASAGELQRFLGQEPSGPARRLRPLVGREELIQRLRGHWQDCQRGAGRMLLLTGAAGSGKSTLAVEFARQLRSAHPALSVLRAKCNPEEPPYGLLRQLLASTAEHIQAQQPPLRGELQSVLKRAAGPHAPLLSQFSPGLGALLGESATAREDVSSRQFLAFSEFLLRAAETLPMLVLIDDLQWIDQSSQQVLRHVAGGLQRTRSLVLATSRLEEIAEVPLPDEQWLRLSNFSQEELEQLLERTLGGPSDPRLLEQVHLASNGNPFVAAALLEAALDEGQLVPHWGSWRLEGDGLARLELPGDAIAAVVAGLDPLEESQLQVLRGAAVLGLRFQASELAKMNPLPFYPVLAEARRLKLLEKLEGDSYRFLHDRIREALLQGLEPEEERRLHAQAAHTVGPEQPFRYAQHLWHSHPEANRETCLAQRSAGLLASQQHAHQEACEFFARAESSRPAHLENTAECAEAHGYACYLTGRFPEALALLQSALPLCSSSLARAQVHQRMAEVYMVEIDTEQAWPAVVRGLRELDIHFSTNAWQGARTVLGGLAAMALTPLGKSREPKTRAAVRLLEVGARVCFIGGPLPLRAFTILEARVRYQQANADRSRLPQFKQALDRVRRSQGHPMFIIHHRALHAGYHRLLGNPARSRQLLAQAEELAHSGQNYWIMIEVAKQRAYLLRDQQLFEAAALQARAAAAMADELGWLAMVHRIEAEFGLNLHSNSGSNREGSSQNATTLRLQRHLKALLEVTQATAQVLEVPRISELVLAEVLRILAAERAFLFLLEDEQLRFQTGRSAEGQILSLPDNYATSVVEQVRSRGRASLLSADEGGQVTSSASIQTHNLRSILAAPMLWRDRLVGVVYLDSRLARGAFSSDDVEVLQALANQVAVSLETARAARLEVQVRGERDQRLLAEQLSEMVGSLLTHLQTEAVLTRLLEGLQRVVSFDSGATLLLHEQGLSRVVIQGPTEMEQDYPLEGVWAEVLHSNRPLLLQDDHWLGAALPSAQGPVGVLVLQRQQPFRRAEVELVHTLASYAGIALENSQLFASVQRMATIDELTGILNRRQFLKEANEELQRADRLGHAVSLVMFDVDHFKKFNDTHGHAIGDLVLRTVSARCKDCLRGIDPLGRLGGEEFAVLLVGTPLEPGCATADRLRLAICGQPFPSSQGDLSVAISLGVAQRQPKEPLDRLLERADEALYAAKRGGRNRVEAG